VHDGYIKFNCNWQKSGPLVPEDYFTMLNDWRNTIFRLHLIGAYSNGIGYGNISMRVPKSNHFFISGSATGNFKKSIPAHYSLVTSFNFKKNSVTCSGPVKASSESLSHAAIYESKKNINAVIHIHHLQMWEQLLTQEPTTSYEYKFGTPEIALEIKKLILKNDLSAGVIVMAGHKEGILFYGQDLQTTGLLITEYYNKLLHE